MVETIKDKVTARTEYNFVPGYIMDAKYEERERANKKIAKIEAKAEKEIKEAKAEIEKLKAELEKLKNN